MENPIEVIEETVEAVVQDVEDFFPHKPGGMIDRMRKERARREAAQHEAENEAERVEEHSYKAVKVSVVQPEAFSTNTFIILPGGYAQILPLSPYRNRATVICSTPESTMVLAKDSSAALGGVGFPMPNGIPWPFNARAQLYAYNPGANPISVSVIVELNAPEC